MQCGTDINCFRQSLPFTVGVKSAVEHYARTSDAPSNIYASLCIVLRLGAAELHTESKGYLMWKAELYTMTSWYSKTLYCSWHYWSSAVYNSNKSTCCSKLLCNNSPCHTYPVYNKGSQQFFHICSRSIYCSITFKQHKLMYSLMMDQLGPKHVAV